MAVRNRGHGPTQCGIIASPTRCTKGGCKLDEGTAYAGRRLKLPTIPERHRLESQSSSRTGENPPYGMIGRVEETSASFEARSAPRSYPTPISGCEQPQQGGPYSITSSAVTSSDGERAIPIVSAASLFMTSLKAVGCSIGSSPGGVPCRILSTYVAIWR